MNEPMDTYEPKTSASAPAAGRVLADRLQTRPTLRVILVGATGLESVLRRDAAVELIRARTPLEAMGELSDPIDETSPQQTVVVIDPAVEPPADSTPGTPGTDDSSAASSGSLEDFLAGLRLIDPRARVLRLARNGEMIPAGYDGSIVPDRAIESLHNLIEPKPMARSTHAATSGKPVQTPSAVPSAAEDAIVDATTSAPEESEHTAGANTQAREVVLYHREECDLLARLSARQPLAPVLLEILKARCGCDEIVFVAADAPCDQSPWKAWASAPVCNPNDHMPTPESGEAAAFFGLLRSPVLSTEQLTTHARWFGAWLGLEQLQRSLEQAAYHDPLTGACNRRFFDSFLPKAIEQARASRRSLTVLVFDIDDFKHFNDAYGHAAGDEILIECVRLLRAAVRPTDKICRIGGDEFAVIFYEPNGPRQPDSRHPTDVHVIAERFRAMVRTARFRKLGDDAPGHLTISGGLATFPWDGSTAEELVERADQLALEGKRQGKNVIAFGPGRPTDDA